jgi:hypothetical protein
MNKGVSVICVLVLVGCGAHMVSSPGATSRSPYAPVNEKSRGGIIKYSNRGLPSLRQARREDAYRQMYTACGGYYNIDAEGPRSEGGQVYGDGQGGITYSSYEYLYIQFSCVSPPRRATQPSHEPGTYPPSASGIPQQRADPE